MNQEFVSLEIAEKLKELGFDETVLAYYDNYTNRHIRPVEQDNDSFTCLEDIKNIPVLGVLAPLTQQVLRWFMEKHGLYISIIPKFYTEGINFNWQILWYLPKEKWNLDRNIINSGTYQYGDCGEYATHESAEIAAIEKMIEIVKTRNNE